jgi:hypothetical protein
MQSSLEDEIIGALTDEAHFVPYKVSILWIFNSAEKSFRPNLNPRLIDRNSDKEYTLQINDMLNMNKKP